jgi:hypothetical protein
VTPSAWPTSPAVIVDEDFPTPVARLLRERLAAPVELVAGGALSGAHDEALVAHAASRGGVIISHNRRDRARFREYVRAWRERGNDTVSVLLLPRDVDDERLLLRTLLLVAWYAASSPPKPETFIWNDVAQPLLHGHGIPGFSNAEIRRALG